MNGIGWLRLFRQTLESDFWLIDQPFTYRDAFIHVLLSANWKPGKTIKDGHVIQIQRGQWLTSIRKLGAAFKWDKHKVYKWLKFMEETDMITSKSVGFGTLLTVVNYDKYQNSEDTVTHTPTHEDTHDVTDTPTHEVTPRYKNKELRIQKEEDDNSALAEPDNEPPIGSPEWLVLHYNDGD